ncbi:type IVB secretion system protein IcmN/DotK [Legionella spiritensis]|uniref:LphA (DotK) n=1 Tax=Legionella spiritensis TaxID=452 RepID=A0A0W0ZAE9_LEGSP|nr:type IVB secretion system protein IcmN/DotK [Legionella spiritensis]KTD66072.1 LphA (DotK) [Legionella spiritensis]SNV44364.1 LphA (DotK) [Legionella spiritensis]VEG90792.1 LphA (DotK) [Legionella spiritensis]
MRHLRVGLKICSTWPATLFVCVLLFGCKGDKYQPIIDSDAYKLPRKVAGTSDSMVITMQKKFHKRGVKVITMGQDYLVSLPSSALFTDQSPRLTWKSYELLNDIVLFLQQFRKIGVNVTGYSSKYVSTRREQALTLARARAVANYLWGQGIDSRFIFTEGAGSDKPAVWFTQGGDESPNSRIEITFRDAIV